MRLWRRWSAIVLVLVGSASRGTAQDAAVAARQAQIEQHLRNLSDSSWSTRQASLIALGSLDAREHAPRIAELLRDGDNDVRREALLTLIRLDARNQAPRFFELLESTDSNVRENAFTALSDVLTGPLSAQARTVLTTALGAEALNSRIAAFLGDSNSRIQARAIMFLGLLGARGYAGQIAEFLSNPGEDLSSQALRALIRLDAREYAPRILEALESPSDEVREAMLRTLATASNTFDRTTPLVGRSFFAEAVAHRDLNILLGSYLEGPVETQRRALQALGLLGDARLAPRVAGLLQSPDVGTRGYAAWTLGMMGASEYAPRISALVNDPAYTQTSVELALSALLLLGARDQVREVATLLDDSSVG